MLMKENREVIKSKRWRKRQKQKGRRRSQHVEASGREHGRLRERLQIPNHLGGKIPNSISPLQPPNGALMHILCEGRKSTPLSIKYFQAREEREGGKTEKGQRDE